MQPAGNQSPTSRRLTVPETADALGVTSDAIRGRIKRGTLRSTKEEDGTVYVFLASDDRPSSQSEDQSETATDHPRPAANHPEMIEVLREHNDYLRRQLEVWQEEARRKDHIIAALAERIPAIEAPPEAPRESQDGPVVVTEASGNSEEARSDAENPLERRGFWSRLWGG